MTAVEMISEIMKVRKESEPVESLDKIVSVLCNHNEDVSLDVSCIVMDAHRKEVSKVLENPFDFQKEQELIEDRIYFTVSGQIDDLLLKILKSDTESLLDILGGRTNRFEDSAVLIRTCIIYMLCCENKEIFDRVVYILQNSL